jgi:hypothetical protein
MACYRDSFTFMSGQLSRIATGHMLHGPGLIRGMTKRFSLLHSVQTGSGAYPVPNLMGTRSSFPGGKAAKA